MVRVDKILIVDDREKDRIRVKSVLSDAGYKNIIEASTAEEAIKKYQAEKPDLVFLDVILPSVSGKEILKRLLEFDSNAKVVMMSVLSRETEMKEVDKIGAVAYFVKPLNPDKLHHIQFALEHV